MRSSALMLCVIVCLVVLSTGVYAYDYQDPSTWGTTYPSCDGSSQSPIDINNVVYSSSLTDLSFSYTPATVTIANDGKKFTADIAAADEAANTFDFNGATYNLDQVHVHWASSGVGSEHSIGGEKFDAELHAIHYKDTFADTDAAVASGQTDAVLVVALFLKVGEQHVELSHVLNYADQVIVPATVSIVPTLDMTEVFGTMTDVYYTYEGSLTTPECDEVVTWVILNDVQTISSTQMDALRSLETSTAGEVISTNVRPLQARNSRIVSTNKYGYSAKYIESVSYTGKIEEDSEIAWTLFFVIFCIVLVAFCITIPKRLQEAIAARKEGFENGIKPLEEIEIDMTKPKPIEVLPEAKQEDEEEETGPMNIRFHFDPEEEEEEAPVAAAPSQPIESIQEEEEEEEAPKEEEAPVEEKAAEPEPEPVKEESVKEEAAPVEEKAAEPEPEPVKEEPVKEEAAPVEEKTAEPEPEPVKEEAAPVEEKAAEPKEEAAPVDEAPKEEAAPAEE